MKALLAFLFVLWLITFAKASDKYTVKGAWMQEGVKWVSAPPDINPNAQWTQVAILFFGKEQGFGLIYCTVGRMPRKYMNISAGDPRNVYKGEWKVGDHAISISYRLIEVTVPYIGQKLPGPMQSGNIKISPGSILTFEGKAFRRTRALDESAREALYGMRAKVEPKISPSR